MPKATSASSPAPASAQPSTAAAATTVCAAPFAAPAPGDFAQAVDLLAALGHAHRQLAALNDELERGYAELVKPKRALYARLSATVSATEAALEAIARRNPAWFAERKTLRTPCGAVKFTRSTELHVADENISVQLVQALAGPDGAARYLRTVLVLNKEVLETLADDQLARFGIARRTKENFSAATEVVDLGKTLKTADRKAAA
jgi:hypothetical protein